MGEVFSLIKLLYLIIAKSRTETVDGLAVNVSSLLYMMLWLDVRVFIKMGLPVGVSGFSASYVE